MAPNARFSLRALIGLLIVSGISACTTATPYQPYRPELAAGVHGGFSEQRLADNHFLVRFHGNELTSRDRVEGYMLYRAAELTVQNGYDWFVIVDRRTEHEVQTYVHPDPLYHPWYGAGYGYWQPNWRYYRPGYGWASWYSGLGSPFWASQIDVTTVESFEADAEIMLNKGAIPADRERAFDARQIMSDLGPSIVLPKPHG